MAFELERLTGFLLDLCGGEGGPGLRAAMRCPSCAGPVTCRIDAMAFTLTCSCATVPDHYRWRGIYHRLPVWLHSDDPIA
jgi:hypothetical protein